MTWLSRILRDDKFGLFVMVFMANMGWGVMSPVLGDVQAEFAISVVQVALANSIFGLARLFLDVPIGLITDRADPRWLRFSGTAVLAAGSAVCALATTFPMLLSGRLLNGVGAAIIQVTNLVWISRLSSNERRGRDLGLYQAILLAGASISPVAGGVLADMFGWRSSFWFATAAALLGFLPMVIGNQDWLGRVKLVGEKVARRVAERKDAKVSNARTAMVVANVITFVMFFSVGGFQNTVVPLFGSNVIKLDSGTIGMALGLSTIIRFGMSLVGGELSDRYGRRAVLIPGLLVIGVGTLLFNFADSLATYCLALTVLSLGRFGNNVPATVLADHGSASRWGLIMGINRSVGDLGLIMGPITMGLILEWQGYPAAAIFSAGMAWTSVLAVIWGISEVGKHRSLSVDVRRAFGRLAAGPHD
jgi:MFS family permease